MINHYLALARKHWQLTAFLGVCVLLLIWATVLKRQTKPSPVSTNQIPISKITPFLTVPSLSAQIPPLTLPNKLTPYAFLMTEIDTGVAQNIATKLGFPAPPTTTIPTPETIYLWQSGQLSLSINQTNPKLYLENAALLNQPPQTGSFKVDADSQKIKDLLTSLNLFASSLAFGSPQTVYYTVDGDKLVTTVADKADLLALMFYPTLNGFQIKTYPRPLVLAFFTRDNTMVRLEILPWIAKVAAYQDLSTIPSSEINSRALTQAVAVNISNNPTVDQSEALPPIDQAKLTAAQIIYHPNQDNGILEPVLELTGKAYFNSQNADVTYLMPVLNGSYQATAAGALR